ncbi:MAG TPA: thioesterase family protein [Microvirga sp.]|jgi:acyl-CoA thioesterase FadM|nr:thioesterase family protein [Microvirga sp.]
MNLWLRLLHLLLTAFRGPKLDPTRDVSRLHFRVWPHDLDTSLHMNNGRYWTLMDLGRADLMIRSGLWRAILREGWVPVVNAAKIRFRRELRLFQSFRLETRILTWTSTFVVMEHRMIGKARDGSDILHAVALVRAALYQRKARRFVTIDEMFEAVGMHAVAPEPTPEVAAFLAAEEAMKQAA